MKLKLYKQAKAEFVKAFSYYASLMYKHFGIVHEQPQLYYSEPLAIKGKQQPQTKYYLKEAERIKKESEKQKKKKPTHKKNHS